MSEAAPSDPADPQTQVRNMVLDFFYKQVCEGKTNQEIFKKLHSTSLPPVSEPELNALRRKFKEMETRAPEKMREFRKRLGVKPLIV